MKNNVWYLGLLCLLMTFMSCSEHDATFDKYEDWGKRNALYYKQVADSARREIAQAKSVYGDNWEEHCNWRMFRTYYKPESAENLTLTDSVCVKVLTNGAGKGSPNSTDTVRIHYRGMLMPTMDIINGKDTLVQDFFDSSFAPPLNLEIASPRLFAVSGLVEGLGTAMQYMHCGDRWMIYVPQELGYGTSSNDKIPAESTLLFDVTLVDYYDGTTEIPDWH